MSIEDRRRTAEEIIAYLRARIHQDRAGSTVGPGVPDLHDSSTAARSGSASATNRRRSSLSSVTYEEVHAVAFGLIHSAPAPTAQYMRSQRRTSVPADRDLQHEYTITGAHSGRSGRDCPALLLSQAAWRPQRTSWGGKDGSGTMGQNCTIEDPGSRTREGPELRHQASIARSPASWESRNPGQRDIVKELRGNRGARRSQGSLSISSPRNRRTRKEGMGTHYRRRALRSIACSGPWSAKKPDSTRRRKSNTAGRLLVELVKSATNTNEGRDGSA